VSCSELQCVAACFSVLRCVAWMVRALLQCVAVCCSVLQFVIVCWSVLPGFLFCSALQRVAVCRSVM